jgi:tetratricopeptide (TPR) repeat protein
LLQFSALSQSISKLDELKIELAATGEDTAKIRILFETGDQFIDGPSDSLMLYYNKALVIIQENYSNLTKDPDGGNEDIIRKYRQFELRAYIEFGIEYFFRSDYNKALDYYFKALEITEESDDKSIASECYSEIGIVYKNQGKYDLALEYNEKALILAKQLEYPSWLAVCYANHGTIYLKKGYYTLALNHYFRALKTFEELGQKRRMGSCYLNIGKIYGAQRDFIKALDYYRRALNISDETGDKVSQTNAYLNIGKTYLNLHEYLPARNYFDSSIVKFEELGYRHELDDCYKNIGHTYKMEKQYEKANEYYGKSLQLSIMEEDMPGMADSYSNLAHIAYLKNDYSGSLEFATKSLEYAEMSGNMNTLKNVYSLLADIYEGSGDIDKALDYYKIYSAIKDSLFNESKYRTIREIEAQFETEKKEQQLALLTEKTHVQQLQLSQRNRIFIASLTGIILIMLIGYLLFRQSKLKSRHKAIELEQRLLRSQMNPHFIFNSLIAIQSYIYKKEPVLAGDYLAEFADLVRMTLENSRVEFILLKNEIKALKAYLELQKLRFEDKFEYSIETDDNIDTENMQIPPMLAQPFIENAIEHGLRHKSRKGYLKIFYSRQNNCIRILIEDNGVGREKAGQIEKKKQHQSLAIDITKERLEVLSGKFKQKYILNLIDLQDENNLPRGTRVNIFIPFK